MQSCPQDNFAPDVVNTLENPRLLSSLRALLYSNNEQNKKTFFRIFLESNLIALTTEAPKTKPDSILKTSEDGYNLYDKNTEISLIQLNSSTGGLILPIFTETKFVIASGLNIYHGIALSAKDILEMALIAESESIVINPASPEFLVLDRNLIKDLVRDLKSSYKLPPEDSLTLVSHTI
jgi:hypothetical protein